MSESYFGIVNDVNDALTLFEAARQKVIPMVTTRLTESSRKLIRPGSIFVWEINSTGMRRWTDGHSWSPSRYHNHFFTYHETDESYNDLHTINYKSSGSSPTAYSFPQNESTKTVRYKMNGLIKRTTSMSTTDGRKFQLVNYINNCSQSNIGIPKINECPILSVVQVPVDYYFRTTNSSSGGKVKHNISPKVSRRSNSVGSLNGFPILSNGSAYDPYSANCMEIYKPMHTLNNNIIAAGPNALYNPGLEYPLLGEIPQCPKQNFNFPINNQIIPVIFQNQNQQPIGAEFDFVYGYQPMNNIMFNSNIYQFQADA